MTDDDTLRRLTELPAELARADLAGAVGLIVHVSVMRHLLGRVARLEADNAALRRLATEMREEE